MVYINVIRRVTVDVGRCLASWPGVAADRLRRPQVNLVLFPNQTPTPSVARQRVPDRFPTLACASVR